MILKKFLSLKICRNVYKIKCSKKATFLPKLQPLSGECQKNLQIARTYKRENVNFLKFLSMRGRSGSLL